MSQRKMIYLSPSALQRWYDLKCPAAFKYDREWELISDEEPDYFVRGTLVHDLLSGDAPVHSVTDPMALRLFEKIAGLRQALGMNVTHAEQWQEQFEIVPGVMWVRRIDALAVTADGVNVVIDYKTAGSPWKVVDSQQGLISPQALSFQSPGYLIPHPDHKRWPKVLVYLIGPYRGQAQMFTVHHSKKAERNMLDTIHLLKESYKQNRFPKNHGFVCTTCPFQRMCYNAPGWKSEYRRKGRSR